MTRAELRQEVIDRGYDYVKPLRIDAFLDRAHREICSKRTWPFLEASVEGTSPLALTDLGRVLTVQSTERHLLLRGSTRRWLLGHYPDLEDTGPSMFWYLEDRTLRVFPVDTGNLLVHYSKRPAALADGDEPLIPLEWQYLMVDRAVVDCLRDDDEYEQARALMTVVREGVTDMASDLMHRNRQDHRTIIRTGGPGDYAY